MAPTSGMPSPSRSGHRMCSSPFSLSIHLRERKQHQQRASLTRCLPAGQSAAKRCAAREPVRPTRSSRQRQERSDVPDKRKSEVQARRCDGEAPKRGSMSMYLLAKGEDERLAGGAVGHLDAVEVPRRAEPAARRPDLEPLHGAHVGRRKEERVRLRAANHGTSRWSGSVGAQHSMRTPAAQAQTQSTSLDHRQQWPLRSTQALPSPPHLPSLKVVLAVVQLALARVALVPVHHHVHVRVGAGAPQVRRVRRDAVVDVACAGNRVQTPPSLSALPAVWLDVLPKWVRAGVGRAVVLSPSAPALSGAPGKSSLRRPVVSAPSALSQALQGKNHVLPSAWLNTSTCPERGWGQASASTSGAAPAHAIPLLRYQHIDLWQRTGGASAEMVRTCSRCQSGPMPVLSWRMTIFLSSPTLVDLSCAHHASRGKHAHAAHLVPDRPVPASRNPNGLTVAPRLVEPSLCLLAPR